MNNFHDILLPEFISIHLKGGPVFATNYASSISGREIRVLEREHAIQKYILSGCHLSESQFEEFNCFFRNRRGMNYSFKIRDHADYKLENQLLSSNAHSSLNFEIFKKYECNISSYFRRITTLREGTVKTNIAVSNIDYINGIISIAKPLLAQENLIISAEFDVLVRFCSDEFKYSFCQDGSILIDGLELQEVIL